MGRTVVFLGALWLAAALWHSDRVSTEVLLVVILPALFVAGLLLSRA